MPNSNGIAPIEFIIRSKQAQLLLTIAQVFGCPTSVLLTIAQVFGCPTSVLDPTVQCLASLPKFSPRSPRALFTEFSQKYSSTDPLVLNLETISITPQYHVFLEHSQPMTGYLMVLGYFATSMDQMKNPQTQSQVLCTWGPTSSRCRLF
jgi:hypothetical protein